MSFRVTMTPKAEAGQTGFSGMPPQRAIEEPTNMERSIEELLTEEPVDAVEAPQVEEAPEVTEQPEGQPRDEHGRFASQQTGEPQPEQAAEEVTPTNPIPDDQFKGYLTEKRKRQELERQIADMQAQFSQFQAQQRSPEPEPDFWDNPQQAIASQVQQAIRQAMEEQQHMQQVERINASEAAARAKYDDYGDAFSAFQQAAMANPALIQQMTRESDPAEFAYRKGKTALQLEQVGSIDELIRNERAKWEQEARAAIPAQSFPSTTATDGSVAARTGPAWSGPAPIGDLLK